MGNLYWGRRADVLFGPVYNPSLIYDNIINKQNILPTIEANLLNLGNDLKEAQRKKYHYSAKGPKNNVHVSDLRVKFNIKKTVEGNVPNKGKIEIYNLKESQWKVLEDDDTICQVKLFVGYRGISEDFRQSDLIHYADITNVSRKFSNGDYICELDTGDGQFAAMTAIINKSYEQNVSMKSMVTDTINTLKDIGIDTLDALNKIDSLDDLKQKLGSILSGKSSDVLDKLSQKFGLTWNINNNKLILEALGKAVYDEILFLSTYSGLIGSPEREKDGISFTSLLISDMDIDKVVYIYSKEVKGYFLIDEIVYVGDTHGNTWECRCKGKPYKRPPETAVEWKIPNVPDLDPIEWINKRTPFTLEDSIKNWQEENQ